MKIFGKEISRPSTIAAALTVTMFATLAVTAPAQAHDSFAFGFSDGRSGFSLGATGGRDRYDRNARWDRDDDRDHRDYRRHRYPAPRYYYPQGYRYVPPPPYYYYPPPRPYYDYGY